MRVVTQIRSAARSACDLTSEGFYRKRDGDFLNYLIMARASMGEASDQIDDGWECGGFSEQQRNDMIALVKRAMKADAGLRAYLERRRSPSPQRAMAGRGDADRSEHESPSSPSHRWAPRGAADPTGSADTSSPTAARMPC